MTPEADVKRVRFFPPLKLEPNPEVYRYGLRLYQRHGCSRYSRHVHETAIEAVLTAELAE